MNLRAQFDKGKHKISINLNIQSEYGKTQSRKNCIFGGFDEMNYKTELYYFHKYVSPRAIYSFTTIGGASFFHSTDYSKVP